MTWVAHCGDCGWTGPVEATQRGAKLWKMVHAADAGCDPYAIGTLDSQEVSA